MKVIARQLLDGSFVCTAHAEPFGSTPVHDNDQAFRGAFCALCQALVVGFVDRNAINAALRRAFGKTLPN